MTNRYIILYSQYHIIWESNRVNMWKTVSARLRGSESELSAMGEDTDGLVTSTSKLQAKVKALTGGFDIMQDKNNYKDIYDIVVGIGERWSEMQDVDRASLLELLAGKNQSNALAAALNNVDVIKNAYNTAVNDSEGSAEREFENYKKGIQYSIDSFKASFQSLSTSLVSSDFVKKIVDGGTGILDVITTIIDKVGVLKTALAGFAGFKIFKNLDLFYLNWSLHT